MFTGCKHDLPDDNDYKEGDPSTFTITDIPATYGDWPFTMDSLNIPGGRLYLSAAPPELPPSAESSPSLFGKRISGGKVTLRAYRQDGNYQNMNFYLSTGSDTFEAGKLSGNLLLEGEDLGYFYDLVNKSAVSFTNGTASVPFSVFEAELSKRQL